MQSLLTYQTTITQDSYRIHNEEVQIGKLFKKEWLGSHIETTINGQHIVFNSTGIINPVVSVTDKYSKQKLGEIKVKDFFAFFPSATLQMSGGKEYCWITKSVFSYNWQWLDKSMNIEVASSRESFQVFKQSGTIRLAHPVQENALFVVAGIHLRSVVRKQNLFNIILYMFMVLLVKRYY